MMFRCPHCREETITDLQKLIGDGSCALCGERFTASSIPWVFITLVVPVVVLGGMILAPHNSWATIGIGILLLIAAVLALLLIFPLLPAGTSRAKYDRIGSEIVFWLILVVLAVKLFLIPRLSGN